MITRIAAKALRELRLAVDKTQFEMAGVFSVSRETWHRWEIKGGDGRVASHAHMYATMNELSAGLVPLADGTLRIDGFYRQNAPRR